MAKIVVAGDAVVVTSAVKLEDIKTVEKYNKKALTLMGGEDNKEPIFMVGTTTGTGSLNAYGASFGSATHDEQKLATITLPLGECVGSVKEYVAEKFGAAIMNLNKVEAVIPGVLAELKEQREKVMEGITIA